MHAVLPQWDSRGQRSLCFHGVPLVFHHNGWKTLPHLLLPQRGAIHNQQEALDLWGLSEDNHRHQSQHRVGHAALRDVG